MKTPLLILVIAAAVVGAWLLIVVIVALINAAVSVHVVKATSTTYGTVTGLFCILRPVSG